MTYSVRNVLGVRNLADGKKAPKVLLFDYDHWPFALRTLYDYIIGCHVSHLLDFSAALLCYLFIFPSTFAEAANGFSIGWIAKIIGYNLAVEFTLYGFWHHMMYASSKYSAGVKSHKFNKINQYEQTNKVGYVKSTSGNLQREIFFTTVGFLISSTYQIVMTYLWANKYVPVYLDFWAYPAWSIFWMMFVTYWRELHFYWVHRSMHPWWNSKGGLANGDIGAFLYRWCHSLHHKSYNPGPWAGLSMHPVEHILYYTCTLTTLFVLQNPLHFLYAKFHADIAPIGGHDGFADPGGNSDYHYLHHAKFEVNYGVPFPVNFDSLFGTWADLKTVQKEKQEREAKRVSKK